MSYWQTAILIIALVSLFLYGLQGLSKEMHELGENRLRQWLTKITNNRLGGFFLGAVVTGVIQSSSAVTSLTVTLVDAGIFSFGNSLAVLLGTNVGTTATAWIVSFKIPLLGPIFIVVGTVVSRLNFNIHLAGKSLFYFGFILFCLDLISTALTPIKSSEEVVAFLQQKHVLLSVLAGIVITAIVQSSSVVTGIAILFIQQQLITLDNAIAIIVGANLGTTTTALVASVGMTPTAKRTAIANFLFNLFGVLIFTPLVEWLAICVAQLSANSGFQLAYAHLFFNLSIGLFFLILLTPITRIMGWGLQQK